MKALSVTELTLQIKRQLELGFTNVFVQGEISNIKLQSSGHFYFTLKDSGAQMSCVLFKGQTKNLS
ncbi:MAG: exodeoxyribonuclease VII large subunit, partial [Chlamydiae bacterium]|nr:exodeoxyribonuclease VII large subunit [Chlamydiota bacterium]